MKHIAPLTVLLSLAGPSAYAADAVDMARAVGRTLDYVDSAKAMMPNLGFTPDSSSLLGAKLRPQSSSAMTITLNAGTGYVFLATGPGGVDLDIILEDDDGDRVAADRARDEKPVVTYEPRRSGRYKVRLSNASGRAVYAVMAMLSTDGVRISPAYTREHLAPLLADAHRAMLAGASVDDRGGWSFMATLLSEDETHRFNRLPTRGRSGVALARGDSDARDIDLVVRSEGRKLGHDIAPDAIPRVRFSPQQTVDLHLKGHDIRRPSLVGLVLLLDDA